MNVIYKYPLSLPQVNALELPESFFVALVAIQEGQIRIWIEHDPEAEKIPYQFISYGTGHPIPKHMTHVGSVISGPYVWHVYYQAVGT